MNEVIMYMMLSLWGIFSTFLLFEAFYEGKDIKNEVKWTLFVFSISIINLVYFKINIPIIILLTNLIMLFVISYAYKSSIKKNIISVFLIYIIVLSGDSLSSMLLSYNKNMVIEGLVYTPLENLFYARSVIFLIAIAMNRYINLKKDGNLSLKNWLIIIAIALISIYMIMLLLSIPSIPLLWKTMGIIGMVIINFAVIYLYSSVLGYLQDKFDKSLYQKELEHIKNQFNTLKDSTANIRMLHHDINNHLSSINGIIKSGNFEQATEYIDDLTKSYGAKSNIVDTGNIVIDSIVNSKIPKMDDMGIRYNLNITVPEDLKMNSVTMTAILSNALDNAIEAVSKLQKDDRWINLNIKYTKRKIGIWLENPYTGMINKNGDMILTSKDDTIRHGLGIKSILETINKENGLIVINTDNSIFKVKIII